ncbi:unnamed protein product [Clavelina lepadiformis]|uniref:R3H domain-containing protein n=1 Tax=Clavelina lepadiformis TaxID=159417 RepID=A0ABP0GA24_CLALP
MFHPLGSFQRYLIHKVTEVFPKLTSFSIGTKDTRRAVVCFKSKKKDQQQLLQQQQGGSKTLPNPNHDYQNLPPRGRVDHGSRNSLPPSRDSSRNRKRNDGTLPNRPSKAQSSGHLPRPLRAKKTATKRDQMKRSRSLQSSPVHMDDPETYLTDDDGRRRPRNRNNDRRGQRSSSLKPPSRRRSVREKTRSPDISDEEPARLSLRHNVSDVSLSRRSQGLRMEGKVVNGDVEDPYSYGDSESDAARVDAEAVRYEKDRHKKSAPETKHRSLPRHHSVESSEKSYSEESEDRRSRKKSREAEKRREYSESDDTKSNQDEIASSGSEDEEEEEYNTDETYDRPPSYDSIKRNASHKKAERNYNRVKLGSHRHSSVEKESSDQENEDKGSSSKAAVKSKRSSSSKRPSKDSAAPKRSSTMPRSMKEPGKKISSSRSQTLKNGSSSTAPRTKNQSKQFETQVKAPLTKESPKRSSVSSSKSKPKSQRSQTTQPSHTVEVRASKAASTDDLLDKSTDTLYMPLPNNKPSPSKPAESKRSTKHASGRTAKSAPTTPVHEKRNRLLPSRCDGVAQTEVTGTLSRRKDKKKDVETPVQNQPEPPIWPDNLKPPIDMLTSMMQYLGAQQQGNPPFQTPFNPNLLNAFHHFMQSNPSSSQSLPPLPPQLMHQLYMSWLGAYYAGATGTWPPPVPPPFMSPGNSSGGPHMPPFDVPPNINPQQFSANYPTTDSAGHPPDGHDHQNQFYPPHYQADLSRSYDRISGGYPPSNDYRDGRTSSNYHYSEPPASEPMSNYDGTTRQQPFNDAYHSNPTSEPHNPSRKFSGPECGHENGHYSSTALTDVETDTSSVLSSNTRGEVAVASNPKGGVMIYVRSQPNSRSGSIAGGMQESMESLNMSDNPPSIMNTPRTSDHGNFSDHRRSPRERKNKSKSRASSLPKNGQGSRKVKRGEEVVTNIQPTNSDTQSTNRNNNNHTRDGNTPLHASDTLLEQTPPPALSAPKLSKSGSMKQPLHDKQSKKPNLNVSSEEMILSLRKAPLATIEDDTQSFLSGSHASSCSSLCSAHHDEKSFKASSDSLPPPPTPVLEESSPASKEPANSSPALSANNEEESEEDSSSSSSEDEFSDSSSTHKIEDADRASSMKDVEDLDNDEEMPKEEDYPGPSSFNENDDKDDDDSTEEIDSDTEESDKEELKPLPTESKADETGFQPSNFEVPLIDKSDADDDDQDASSQADSLDRLSDKHIVRDPSDVTNSVRNGAAASDTSSLSEGNAGNSASDSSYDADQSRFEEVKKSDNLLKDLDGDIVVQDPQFDYYNWKPNKDKYRDEKYGKFVEVYNISPDLSDIGVTKYLTKYKGLRLSRVDHTLALCTLPSPDVAMKFLKEDFPAFDTRPLYEASEKSKKKADFKLEDEDYEAVRATRPPTDPAVAKRLIAGSLGNSKYRPSGDTRRSKGSKKN